MRTITFDYAPWLGIGLIGAACCIAVWVIILVVKHGASFETVVKSITGLSISLFLLAYAMGHMAWKAEFSPSGVTVSGKQLPFPFSPARRTGFIGWSQVSEVRFLPSPTKRDTPAIILSGVGFSFYFAVRGMTPSEIKALADLLVAYGPKEQALRFRPSLEVSAELQDDGLHFFRALGLSRRVSLR